MNSEKPRFRIYFVKIIGMKAIKIKAINKEATIIIKEKRIEYYVQPTDEYKAFVIIT